MVKLRVLQYMIQESNIGGSNASVYEDLSDTCNKGVLYLKFQDLSSAFDSEVYSSPTREISRILAPN